MAGKKSYGKEADLNLKLVIGLSRTTQLIHRHSGERFKEAGLSLAQFAVLEALYHKGEMSIREITRIILSTPGNMTVVIRNLERQGLIATRTRPEDRRSTLAAITPLGVEKIKALFPGHLQDLEEAFSPLSETEKEGLISLLKKLKADR